MDSVQVKDMNHAVNRSNFKQGLTSAMKNSSSASRIEPKILFVYTKSIFKIQ